MNVYDGYPYPYGFGVSADGGVTPMLDEGKRLASELAAACKLPILNITIGNPYTNPHVNRPYDVGNYIPLEGVSRMMRCVSEMQQAIPAVPVIGAAFSYLRQHSANLAAGMVAGGHAAMAGYGRMAFANPDFPLQIMQNGTIDPSRVCIACGQCALLLRAGEPAGCVVRDRKVYRRWEG